MQATSLPLVIAAMAGLALVRVLAFAAWHWQAAAWPHNATSNLLQTRRAFFERIDHVRRESPLQPKRLNDKIYSIMTLLRVN
jgi:hypothetical protein